MAGAKKIQCEGPCGRDLAHDEVNFRRVKLARVAKVVLTRRCRVCHAAATRRAKVALDDAARAAYVRPALSECNAKWHRGPRLVASDLFRTKNGKPRRRCYACEKEAMRLWRLSDAGAKWRKGYRSKQKKHHKRYNAKPEVKARRKRDYAVRSERGIVKAQSRIRYAVARGYVAKPGRCQKCLEKTRARALRSFLPGPSPSVEHSLFFCARCHVEARGQRSGGTFWAWLGVARPEDAQERRRVVEAKRLAARFGADPDVADHLTIPREEWQEFHREHVAEWADEAPLLAPGQFHYGRAPRVEGAERFLMMALGMEV